jgi:hypothetical protein
MKHLDNTVGPVKRQMRRFFEALRKTNRFGCDLHLREFFEDYKRKFAEITAKSGMSLDQYQAGLQMTGQADSISSRQRYLIEFEAAEGEQKAREGA